VIELCEFSDKLHAQKYRADGESFREAVNRWAGALSDNQEHFNALQDIFGNQRFLMGGRNQSAIGSPRQVTPYNCFVSRKIHDSLTGRGSIADAFTESLRTMQMGGGIGFDFSTLRPRGDIIRKLGSQASGPVSFMEIFDAGCRAIASAGHRRGAMMAVLRIDHPDIMEFIRCKQNENRLNGFNISIGVTDEFMRALEKDDMFSLKFRGRAYGKIKAKPLWEMVMQSNWDWSEPGVLFIDRINEMNNLWYCETINATNPCGEQPLPAYGACLLGSFNLAAYLVPSESAVGEYNDWYLDKNVLLKDIPHVVRAMDNIVDVADYPLEEQKDEAVSKRRMGLGVSGVANALEAVGSSYGSSEFLGALREVMETIRDTCYKASVDLAKEKGSFPLFDKEKYVKSKFVQTFPKELQEDIYEHGIRNSHLLSIAPTGTISMCANNISSGIEPVLYYEADRTVQTFDGPVQLRVEDYGRKYLGISGKLSRDITLDEHVAVQTVAQTHVDSAVSKTINFFPSKGSKDFYHNEFQSLYTKAWKSGLKGLTTHNEEGKRMGLFKEVNTSGKEEEEGVKCGLYGKECG